MQRISRFLARNHDGLITDPYQISAGWLTRTLYENGFLEQGRVKSLAIEPWRSQELSWLLRLRVEYSADASPSAATSLILKFTKERQASARSAALGQGEHQFYTDIAVKTVDPPVPRCYDAAYNADLGRSHLLLEDLSASHYRPAHPLPPSVAEVEQIVDALARIHGFWWNDPRLGTSIGSLPDEAWYSRRTELVADVFPRFVDEMGDLLSSKAVAALESIVAFHPTLLRRQRSGNLTVSHGDAHSRNFLIPRDPADGTASIIDWELWNLKPGTNDLAYLLAIHWYPDVRAQFERPLVERYHRRLQEAGVVGYGWDECWVDYRLSVANELLDPFSQWDKSVSARSWWDDLARNLMAYEDLGCAELIT